MFKDFSANARLFLAFLLILVSFAVQKPAWACKCAALTEERSLEIINNAALIFEGSIAGLEKMEEPEEDFDYSIPRPVSQNPFFAKIRLKVIDLYKGTPESNRIEAYVDVTTSCGYTYMVGDFARFILNEAGGVLVQADLCNDPLPVHWKELQEGKYKL